MGLHYRRAKKTITARTLPTLAVNEHYTDRWLFMKIKNSFATPKIPLFLGRAKSMETKSDSVPHSRCSHCPMRYPQNTFFWVGPKAVTVPFATPKISLFLGGAKSMETQSDGVQHSHCSHCLRSACTQT